jgi:short-subunit dehydrogenase
MVATYEYASILITGASSGIGRALALDYAAPGVRLVVSGRDESRLRTTAEECRKRGADVAMKVIDVRDAEAMSTWMTEADDTRPLELIIANAGVSSNTSGDGDTTRLIAEININGTMNTVAPLLDRLTKRRQGQIAIMSSMAAFHGMPGAPAYAASKAWCKSYGEGLRGRLRRHNVGVSVICPGFVESRITAGNRFPMPLFMEASKAARIIRRGLSKNLPRIAFPLTLYFLAWLLGSLPPGWTERLFAKMPDKE